MHGISEYEAIFLAAGQRNSHVKRAGRILLSLPVSRDGAKHAINLYRPQRRGARLMVFALNIAVNLGLHCKILKRGHAAVRDVGLAFDFKYAAETVGILVGSAEHVVPRAIASYLGENSWEVAKLGFGPQARLTLRNEAEILHEIASNERYSPRCLGLHEQGEITILRMPYLTGTSVLIGESEAALDMLSRWIGTSAPKAIDEFSEWVAIRCALEKTVDGKAALERLSGYELHPVISHGDFARWNLLQQADGSLIALDWEWGLMDGMPGLDLVHYFAQDFRLVKRMSSKDVIRKIEIELAKPKARDYLRKTGWGDCSIEPILASVAYKQGGGHQKNPELLAACIEEYLSHQRAGSEHQGLASSIPHLTSSSNGGSLRQIIPATHPDADCGKIYFSVITPSFRQVEYLRCSAASVRDQVGGFGVEHLIQDGGSGSDFDRWAAEQQGAVCVAEHDDGMYDAINRGFHKAKGDIIAWLNCDEQYLPGTLERVHRYFADHPETDVLFGDVILVNELMTPLAYRRAVVPAQGHLRASHLSTFSAATFVRRRILDDGHFLQTRWKTIADAVWIDELLTAGYRMAVLPEPLAIFCMLGTNLGQSELLLKERREWELELGMTCRWRKQWHVIRHRMMRLWSGAYWMRKVVIDAYIPGTRHREVRAQWISGHWDHARNIAARLRTEQEGAMGGVVFHERLSRWTLAHALCVIAIAVYVDGLTQDDAVKGPAILLVSFIYLTFGSKLRDLILICVAYALTASYVLSDRPLDVQVVRLVTFAAGSIVAIFSSVSLQRLKERHQSTAALIRGIPSPMLLTDRFGKVILVNKVACAQLASDEQRFLKKELMQMRQAADGSFTRLPMMRDENEKLPEGVIGLTLKEGDGSLLANAHVFAVGRGKYRVYAFTLESSD